MIEVYGASDDLIEIEGSIREELSGDEGLVAFDDGTILRVEYTNTGVWRIATLRRGTAFGRIEQCEENDEDNYSDRAFLRDGPSWAIFGTEVAWGVR